MGMFRASLGVTCAAFHEQGDFASDAKPEKEIARKMILMTRQINTGFPAGWTKITRVIMLFVTPATTAQVSPKQYRPPRHAPRHLRPQARHPPRLRNS